MKAYIADRMHLEREGGDVSFHAGVVLLVGTVATVLHFGSNGDSTSAIVQGLLILAGAVLTSSGARARRTDSRKGPRTVAGSELLDRSGIAFWEQDWTELARWRKSGRGGAGEASRDPDDLDRLIGSIGTRAANLAAVTFAAPPASSRRSPPLLPPFEDDVARAAVDAFLAGRKAFETETRLLTRSGESTPVLVAFRFPAASERGSGVLVSATDLSYLRSRGPASAPARGMIDDPPSLAHRPPRSSTDPAKASPPAASTENSV